MNKPKLNFVTLMVPRPNVEELLASWAKHCVDRKDYEWHWIVHIDSIPILEQVFPYQQAHDLAEKLGRRYFDGYTIMLAKENKGHSQSFINCMAKVRYDYFYMEDDKLFIRDFDVGDYIRNGAHQFNLQDIKGKVGHTSSGFCRKELAMKMVELWPPEGAAKVQDVEHFYKRRFQYMPEFKKGSAPPIADDNGMKCTNQQGLVRRYINGQLRYEKAPDVIITTFITNKAAAVQWRASKFIRNWMLSLESYRTVVYANAMYPELQGWEVKKAARWGNFERQACGLGENVMYINPYIRPYKVAKFTFNMVVELQKDVHEWPHGEIVNNSHRRAPERLLPLMKTVRRK